MGDQEENKLKKRLLTILTALFVIAWFTYPLWLSALLEWIIDSLDGAWKIILLVAICIIFILFIVTCGPSRYGEKDPAKRLFNFILYIILIAVGIIVLAFSS